MKSKKDEALLAKRHAENRFSEKDFVGAKNFALKAQMLFPELEGISQMIATFDIYVASTSRLNGEIDFYTILGLKPSVDRSMIKKQYKRLVVLLHPDKNRTVGADGAFRLVSEAWTHLSDKAKRASFDLKRKVQLSSFHDHCGYNFDLPTFWTVCTSCQVQYEYLRKYVNKRLSCKNCHGTFLAVELGIAPVNGAYIVSQKQLSFSPGNGHSNHGYGTVPGNTVIFSGNGIPTHHSGDGCKHFSNGSFQWSTSPITSAGNLGHNGYTETGQSNGNLSKSCDTKVKRPYKRRKVEIGGSVVNGNPLGTDVVTKAIIPIEDGCSGPKFSVTNGSSVRLPIPPPLDIRTLFIEKARTSIRRKLDEMNILHLKPTEIRSVTLTVPDSDFHNFDQDRTEESLKPKQIWALYDEEDGMPRLYCLVRQILSLNPFKIHISYLGSKTDSEFGSVNWIDSGFTKSCGNFRAMNTDIVEEVNMFSHRLTNEKAGRGGCVRIFPRSGDIWAVYRNWSTDWNRSTPYNVRHQYEMVEILNNYSEDYGVSVTLLVKVEGYKTVYKRKTDKDAVWWVPRREMVRFSHRVPSLLLKEVSGLPDGCWDLDPAATPDDLLQPVNGMKA